MTESSDVPSGEEGVPDRSVAGTPPYTYGPGPYAPAPQPYWGLPPSPTHPKNGLGMASLVVAIVALLLSVSVIGGVIFGFVAVIIGLAAHARVRRGEATNGGVAITGIVLGIVAGVVVPAIIMVALVSVRICSTKTTSTASAITHTTSRLANNIADRWVCTV